MRAAAHDAGQDQDRDAGRGNAGAARRGHAHSCGHDHVHSDATATGERGEPSHGAFCKCHSPMFTRINVRLHRDYAEHERDGTILDDVLAAGFASRLDRRALLRGAGALAGLAAAAMSAPTGAQAQTSGQATGQTAGQPTQTGATEVKPILITNVRIFDGLSAKTLEGRNVLIRGDRIEALLPKDEIVEGAEVIDAGGRTLMPGMIDCHWHSILCGIPEAVALTAQVPYVHLVAAYEAERTLMRGFTTVRDVGGPSFALKRAVDSGKAKGPRIYPAGAMISQTSGHGDFRLPYEIPASALGGLGHAEKAGISSIADGVPEVLKRVREQLLLGASQIKIMTGGGVSSHYDPIQSMQFTPAEIQAAVGAAEDWGTYVCAHVYTAAGIRRSIENGVQCIEHGQLADEETAKMIADTGTWWSIQPFLADEDSNPKATEQQRREQLEISEGTKRCFEWAQKYDCKLVWGTDILFSPAKTATQGRQLAKMSGWFSNADALRLATGRAGELLSMSGLRNPYPGKVGVIEEGAMADVLLIDGDPLEDIWLIADPKNIAAIMQGGRFFKKTL